MAKLFLLLIIILISSVFISAQEIYVNSKSGNDKNSAVKSEPIKTIGEAAKRANNSSTGEACTIILSEGVYLITINILIRTD